MSTKPGVTILPCTRAPTLRRKRSFFAAPSFAEGDFIVALYNPASKRRKARLAEARDILLTARAEDTPVVIARNVGREGEHTELTRLGQLDSGLADMLSVILIGNSRTRITERGTGRWVYTPRGYGAKIDDL